MCPWGVNPPERVNLPKGFLPPEGGTSPLINSQMNTSPPLPPVLSPPVVVVVRIVFAKKCKKSHSKNIDKNKPNHDIN